MHAKVVPEEVLGVGQHLRQFPEAHPAPPAVPLEEDANNAQEKEEDDSTTVSEKPASFAVNFPLGAIAKFAHAGTAGGEVPAKADRGRAPLFHQARGGQVLGPQEVRDLRERNL